MEVFYARIFTVWCRFSPHLIHLRMQADCTHDRPPPGEQAYLERYSLGYFMRPADNALLRPLSDLSPMIREAADKNKDKKYDTGCTAQEWISRRVKFQRVNNRSKVNSIPWLSFLTSYLTPNFTGRRRWPSILESWQGHGSCRWLLNWIGVGI